ncbi:hypothetical protein B7R22_01980 [Subtercola boreus]|uniref:Uncharacterized protein n=1 Tax=Subtercola boreus TaxID=120213 RepID=A0A3E0W4Z1_9MICO|nr:hypothetical protein [Subtercola boreus]RFA17080.1 hypothetical protein B7R22_01980 [Subtercola boreus]
MIPKYRASTPDLVDDQTEQARTLRASLWLVALFGAGLIPPILIAAGFLNSFLFLKNTTQSDRADNAQMTGGLVYVLIGAGVQLASTIAVWVIAARLARIRGRSSSTSTVLSVFVAVWLAGTVLGLTFYAAIFFQNYHQ